MFNLHNIIITPSTAHAPSLFSRAAERVILAFFLGLNDPPAEHYNIRGGDDEYDVKD